MSRSYYCTYKIVGYFTYLFELKVDPSEEDGFGRHLEEVLDGLAVAQQRNQPGNLLQVDVAEEESLKDI